MDATVFPPNDAGLCLEHNPHLRGRQALADYVREFDEEEWASPDQRDKAIATGSLWVLQWWPDTPVGSCVLCAADLDVLLATARSC